ncbi:hypothetical protein Tco_1388470 [Tanacetum coccineum]
MLTTQTSRNNSTKTKNAFFPALLGPHGKEMEFEKPSQDFTRSLGSPSGLKGLLHTLNATVIPMKLYRRMVEIFQMVDVARGSRLGAWLRACCLFILSSKSRGVFRSNSTLVLEFSFP